jgi:hypothetical protein
MIHTGDRSEEEYDEEYDRIQAELNFKEDMPTAI